MTFITVLIILAIILFININSSESKKKDEPTRVRTKFVGEVNYYDYSIEDLVSVKDKGFVVKVIAGKAPDSIVISGEDARGIGFKPNNIYLINCIEQESVWYKKKYQYSIVKQLNKQEVLNEINVLGSPDIIEF